MNIVKLVEPCLGLKKVGWFPTFAFVIRYLNIIFITVSEAFTFLRRCKITNCLRTHQMFFRKSDCIECIFDIKQHIASIFVQVFTFICIKTQNIVRVSRCKFPVNADSGNQKMYWFSSKLLLTDNNYQSAQSFSINYFLLVEDW